MGQPGQAATSPTRSLLTIDLDCPWCLNATIEALRADPHVMLVEAHSAKGCLEVTHTGAVDGVLRTINGIGHTIEVASNGEAVMAPATVHVEASCQRHNTPAITRITIGQPAP
ncbi:MAG: hypothetical protein U0Q07_06520 [Acidimicrobiales bacterium]